MKSVTKESVLLGFDVLEAAIWEVRKIAEDKEFEDVVKALDKHLARVQEWRKAANDKMENKVSVEK